MRAIYRPHNIWVDAVSTWKFASLALFAITSGCSLKAPEAPAPVPRFPLHWHVGSVDPRFEISEKDLRARIDRAMLLWDNAAHKKLFVYDPIGGFPIDVVFDQRQETIDIREHEKAQLSNGKAQVAAALQKEQQAANQFVQAKQTVQEGEAAFAERLQAYNRRVAYWNSMGGAPENEVFSLDQEKDSIESERVRVQEAAQQLQVLQDRAKALAQDYYGQVQSYNLEVRQYNQQFGPGHAQTVGECILKGDEVMVE